MNPHIFVYGTLMSHTRTEKALALMREGESLGPATIKGVLYRVDWYPGLVEGDGVCHGEVYRLKTPQSSLVWLDAYEGIVPGNHELNRDQYERVERQVRLASGETVTAWVYLYLHDVKGLSPVAEGRWPG